MVGGVTDASEGGGGESSEGAVTHRELTGEEKDIACYNHEFFHGGMAKTISSKNESTKLKVSLFHLAMRLSYIVETLLEFHIGILTQSYLTMLPLTAQAQV